MESRLKKLEGLEARGILPYPYRFERTHTACQIVKQLESLNRNQTPIRTAGRLISRREHGKTCFGHIQDQTGRVQVYFRQDRLGENYGLLDYLDLGDFIGVKGEAFRTKTGEPTVLVDSLQVLAKTLRPLPEKWHGLKETELRYRARYLDLIANPRSREVFLIRTQVIQKLREFLDARDYLEVETPVLQPIYGGASARPFMTDYEALGQRMFLRIADELYLKRMLIGGVERVYELSKDFRNEGVDRFHAPEFTQLEFYEAYKDYEDMMALTEELFNFLAREVLGGPVFSYQGQLLNLSPPWPRVRFLDLLEAATGTNDFLNHSQRELLSLARSFDIEAFETTTKAKLLDKLFAELVRSKLFKPTFVIDHPKLLSPLAKAHRKEPELSERFQVVIGGLELANAFSELNDPREQRARFEAQIRDREEYALLDEDFLSALEYGMPPCAGVGIGIDRLVMLFTDSRSIRDVILFPQLKMESADV
jgi:lysyl-tRNA synthetase class 2